MKEIGFWVIVALAFAVGVLLWILDPKIPDCVGKYVLLLTLVAVVLYTRETHRLRRLSAKQIEVSQEQLDLNQRPHLEIVFKRAHFRLHNIGYGPATNVRIDPVQVFIESYSPIRLKFTCPPIVRKDDHQSIEIKVFWAKTDGLADNMGPGIYTPPMATETIKIRVHYENLSGKHYERELIIGKDMPIDSNPVDFLLQYLYEKFPAVINPNEIPELYVRPKDRMKLIQYCHGKGFVNAGSIKENDRVVEYDNLVITPEGIDYLKGGGGA